MKTARRKFREAHASRVLVLASRRNELPGASAIGDAMIFLKPTSKKVRTGGTPLPARKTRALPGNFPRHLSHQCPL